MVEVFNLFRHRPAFVEIEYNNGTPIETFSIQVDKKLAKHRQHELFILRWLANQIFYYSECAVQKIISDNAVKYKTKPELLFKRQILTPSISITSVRGLKEPDIIKKLKNNNPDDLIFIYQLPTVLSFSYKFKAYYQQLPCLPCHKQHIEGAWHTSQIYRRHIKIIWTVIDSLNNILKKYGHGIRIKRINGKGEHNGKYYYLFTIKNTKPTNKTGKKQAEATYKKRSDRRRRKRKLRYRFLR